MYHRFHHGWGRVRQWHRIYLVGSSYKLVGTEVNLPSAVVTLSEGQADRFIEAKIACSGGGDSIARLPPSLAPTDQHSPNPWGKRKAGKRRKGKRRNNRLDSFRTAFARAQNKVNVICLVSHTHKLMTHSIFNTHKSTV